jgi:hypothetical protein
MTSHAPNRMSVRKNPFTGQWIVYRDGFMAHIAATQPDATRWSDRIVEDAARSYRWRNAI